MDVRYLSHWVIYYKDEGHNTDQTKTGSGTGFSVRTLFFPVELLGQTGKGSTRDFIVFDTPHVVSVELVRVNTLP